MILHHVDGAQVGALQRILDYIAETDGFVTPAQAEGILTADAPAVTGSRTPWLVTLDDGFASNFELVSQVLGRRGIKAVLFICPGLVDAPTERQRRFAEEYVFPGGAGEPPCDIRVFMTWDEIAALRDAGHTIGSHSMMHRRLSHLSRAEVSEDVEGSAARLEQVLGEKPRWFAYPFGDVESISADAMAAIASRFAFCCSGVRGANSPRGNPSAILRDSIDLNAPREYQMLIIDGGLDILYRAQRRALMRMATAHSR